MPQYIKARSGPQNSVIYTDIKGKDWKFIGGNRPWRNQNPGNLVVGDVSKRGGAIGNAGGFAVFPDYKTGHEALLDLLKNVYGDFDIPALMKKYAPAHENDTKKYVKFLRKKTGVKDSRKLKDFSVNEFEKLWHAIELMEGWSKKEGQIKSYQEKAQITGVRKDEKGTIQYYQIDGYGWVSKADGIRLAKQIKVDAVIVTSSRGIKYLRARPNGDVSDNLGNLG